MIAPEYFNNHVSVEGEIIVKSVPNDAGFVLVWNPTTKKISRRTHAEIATDLGLVTASNEAFFNRNRIRSETISSVPVSLDAYLPQGGFISSYNTSSWGGSDRPINASYGGYIKFSDGNNDFNNLELYYNNGHNTPDTHRLWFRTKNNLGSTNWFEAYHSGNLNPGDYWEKLTTGFRGINDNDSRNFSFLSDNGSIAKKINTGGLLVSDIYSNETYVPANGIWSKGNIQSNSRVVSSREGFFGAYDYTQTQGVWSIGESFNVNSNGSITDLGNQYGMAYSYIDVGGSSFANVHQIHFASAGVAQVSIDCNYGRIRGREYQVIGGNSTQFLKADGSLDSASYVTSSQLSDYVTINTPQEIEARKIFRPGIGNRYDEASLELRGSNANSVYPTISFHQPGLYAGTISLRNLDQFSFRNTDDSDFNYLLAKGYIISGLNDNYLLLAGGGYKAISDFATTADLSNVVTINTPQTIIANKNFAPTATLTLSGNDVNLIKSYTGTSGNEGMVSAWVHRHYSTFWRSGNRRGGNTQSLGYSIEYSEDDVTYTEKMRINPDGLLVLSGGGKVDPYGNLNLQQNTSGGSATGIWWNNKDDSGNRIAGIGALTTNGELDYMYLGWGTSPWDSGSNLAVSNNTIQYKNNVMWHAGNFNPDLYLKERGGYQTGAIAKTDFPLSITDYTGDPSTTGFQSYYGTSFHFKGPNSWYNRLDFSTSGEIFLYQGINVTDMSLKGYIPVINTNVTNWTSINFNPSIFFSNAKIVSKEIGNVATTLDAELPNGGFITSYYNGDWGGSDRPYQASYGGYIKFSKGTDDNNNLDFYYNNGHGGLASRIWFRTKEAVNGVKPWMEFYHTGNFDPNTKVNRSGDAMTGALLIGNNNIGKQRVLHLAEPTFLDSYGFNFYTDTNTGSLTLHGLNHGLNNSAPILSASRVNNFVGINKENPASELDVNGYVTSNGFIKNNSSDDYFLMGGGGQLTKYSKEDAFVNSGRDFPDGTLITTNIDYSQTHGDSFLLEIKGNMYGGGIPMDTKVQGYIYADTIINQSGYSTYSDLNTIVAMNINGNLCFWFPRLWYWQGFSVKVIATGGGGITTINRVISIDNSPEPAGTKHVKIAIYTLSTQSWVNNQGFLTSANLNGYVTQSSLNTQLGNYATLNGVQTFNNTNTFNQSPVIPNGTLGNHAVNLNQLLDVAPPYHWNYVGQPAITNRRVLREMTWNNYGNNHTIFDISSGTTPWGASKSNVDAEQPWSPSYPTLVGGNGSGTYGLRVDSARNADNLGGISAGNYATQVWVNTNYIPKSHPVFNITQANINSWNAGTGGGSSHTHFNLSYLNNIDQYLGIGQDPQFGSIRLMDSLGYGLLALQEGLIGGEIGLVDTSNKRFYAGRINEYLKYGSSIDGFEGLNMHFDAQLLGIGREIGNDEDKVQLAGDLSVDTIDIHHNSRQLILNPLYNTNGDVRRSRNAHIYIVTRSPVRLPDKPILGQRIEIFNDSDSDIEVTHGNVGTMFKVPAFCKVTGIAANKGFRFDAKPIDTKQYDI